jgi:4-hydroxy-2-oxoheptanedioate aldolase
MQSMTTSPTPAPDSDLSLGAWSILGSPLAASILAGIGADWLLLDGQHGLFDDATMVATLAALAGTGRDGRTSDVLVRVPSNDAAAIGRALDAGATGVVVPMVQDEHDAARAAAACRYPPAGERSWGAWTTGYGTPASTAAEANARVTCAVMIETPSALERVDAIARTPGVDILFVGPFDLSLSLGTDHATLLADESPDAPLRRVVRACRDAGVRAGAFAGSVDAARVLRRHGFTWISVLTDTTFLAEAGADMLRRAREAG